MILLDITFINTHRVSYLYITKLYYHNGEKNKSVKSQMEEYEAN